MPPLVVRLLMRYSEQRVKVRWKSALSSNFGVSSGVRQGGVLSPILFTVYIDELLLELEKAGVGCYWRHHFVGAVCYADDVALLAPSHSALRLILDSCRRIANSLSLFFNAAKTQQIFFSSCASDTIPVHRTLFFLRNRCPSARLLHMLVIYSAMISRTPQTSELKRLKILPRKLISCCTRSPVVINSLRPVYIAEFLLICLVSS